MDQAWKSVESDSDDITILRVPPAVIDGTNQELQDVTDANILGDTPEPATPATVQGFTTGADDQAISCSTGLGFTRGNPTFGVTSVGRAKAHGSSPAQMA